MYKIIKYSFLFCGMAIVFGGCKKYLDEQPDNILTSEMVWQKAATAVSYLNQVYSSVQCYGDDYPMLGAGDDVSCSIAATNVRQMVAGNWSAQSGYWLNWSAYYIGIRQSLVFQQNIGSVPTSEISDSLKNQYKAEAIFLRGWFYWQIMRQYGPFVILRNVVGTSEDYSKYTRAPFDSCVAEINSLMDQAASSLPDVWQSTSNYGRPTKGACLSIKSEAALWAASPLWNGNAMFSNFKNNDGGLLAPASYDANKWKVAADAAKAVIDKAVYKLYYNTDDGDANFDPVVSYRGVFTSNWTRENIFATPLIGSWNWGLEKRCAPSPGGYNMQNATQNVVDAFYMRNGRTIDDAQSGYTETGFAQQDDPAGWGVVKDGVNRGYVTGNSNMYVDREARFYASIQYNGKPVTPAPTVDTRNYFSSSANADGRGRAEFYYGGKSGVYANNNGDITGYDVLKFSNPATDIYHDQAIYRPFIHLRYAQILLNYIEALNEYDPSNADIIKYLDAIHERAGLPDFETVYPDSVGNQTAMRNVILQERQIELCFEGDRYFTLLRRLMMGNAKSLNIYRMSVNANDNGLGFGFAGFYNRNLLQTRVWSDKCYLFPMYQNDLDVSKGLVQNPGW